jgi:hypothetical protein
VVRWAFEVKIKSSSKWDIAFTNPTAGPWKRVTSKDKAGNIGEVHRFAIDEKRPDLILYSDAFKTVLIIEAKTTLQGLTNENQILKTCDLFTRLRTLLESKGDNEFWSERAKYKYELGLLWGKVNESREEIGAVSQSFFSNISTLVDDILCIQGEFSDEVLGHSMYWGNSGLETTLESYQS